MLLDQLLSTRAGCQKLARNTELSRIPVVPVPRQNLTPKHAGAGHKKPMSLVQVQEEFGIPDLAKHFRERLEKLWGAEIMEKVCGPASDFLRTVSVKVYPSITFYYRPFQQPLEVEKQLLRCSNDWRASKKDRTHDIWVRRVSERNKDTF